MLAAAVGDVLDLGFLGIAGFGVWRGQNLWSRHIELKHERETSRLSMDRMEKSIRLEIDQNKALAEIEQMQNYPELAQTTGTPSAGSDSYVCECRERPVPHIHHYYNNKASVMLVPVGLLEQARKGDFGNWTFDGKPLTNLSMMKAKQ